MMEIKNSLRAQIKAKIATVSQKETKRVSARIAAHILQSAAYQAAKTVFCFVGTAREIDTMDILKDALAQGKTVCVPFCTDKGIMVAKQITTIGALKPGAYDILAPDAAAQTVAPQAIDLALLPCLAADANGNRLGYGGGYYDRYLSQLCRTATTICLCRAACIVPNVPHEAQDIAAEQVMTENGFLGVT